jgi:hypothetical protein
MPDAFFTFKSSSNTARTSSLQGISQGRRILSEHDRQIISQYLIDAEDDVRRCEAEARRLLATMKVLENRRKGLEKSMGYYRSFLSPIHRLPSEVLCNIFDLCCEWTHLSYSSRKPRVIELSEVCGRWRDIILSTPSLWATLDLDLFTDTKEPISEASATKLTEMVRMFTERSRNTPLTLEFREPRIDAYGRGFTLAQAIQLGIRNSIPIDPLFPGLSLLRAMVRCQVQLRCRTYYRHPGIQKLRRAFPDAQASGTPSRVHLKAGYARKCPCP